MRIMKELAVAGPALVLLLLISDAFLGPDAFDRQSLTSGRCWIGADQVPAERWFAKDSIVTGASWQGAYPASTERRFARTAAARVREVFAQFVPGESGRAS
jgi:hypothetical protein